RLCCCRFALRGCCRRRRRVLRSGSGGSSLLRRRHVVYRTDGWTPNCWWRVSPGRTDTTTARDKHSIQVVIFSLSIQCVLSMNITGGIYRWRYASNVQLLFYTLTTVIYPEYSWTYT